jgi:hypothetical protein
MASGAKCRSWAAISTSQDAALSSADLDGQRDQIVAGLGRHRPLDQAQVARPDHPDPLTMPRLLAEPAQCGQSIGALIERTERST